MEEVVPIMNLTDFIRFNINCVHFFGYFVPQFQQTYQKYLYAVYAITFVGCSFVLTLLTQVCYMVQSFGDMEKMTEASYLLFTNIVQCFKMTCFFIYGPRIWKLVHTMNKNEFKPRTVEQYEILQEKINISKRNSKLFLLGCTITCVSWATSPLMDKNDGKVRLPLSGWYPFPTQNSPAFELVYIYQILSTWVCGLADISMDTFMSGTIMFISAQLSVLNTSLETMENTENLTRNVEHHRSIIEFSDEVSVLFTPGITAQFVVGAIVVCMSMFQLSLMPVVSFQFLALFMYQTCVLIEIYLWCFYGNEIILESDRLTQSAYMCKWAEGSKGFKENLVIFLSRTQFSLKLYASGYFTLSLETFKAIAKSSWSYFAVLNQIHQPEMI